MQQERGGLATLQELSGSRGSDVRRVPISAIPAVLSIRGTEVEVEGMVGIGREAKGVDHRLAAHAELQHGVSLLGVVALNLLHGGGEVEAFAVEGGHVDVAHVGEIDVGRVATQLEAEVGDVAWLVALRLHVVHLGTEMLGQHDWALGSAQEGQEQEKKEGEFQS